MTLNEYIADLLPKLNWRHFGVGALQAYLHEGSLVEQRLHIWHPSLIKPGITGFGDAHNHRFSFLSQVLCGTIENVIWDVSYSDERVATHDVYEVENARAAHVRTGSHDGSCRKVGWCVRTRTVREFSPRTSTYEFPRGTYHQTRAHGLTVTLVTKFNQQPTPARILCPKGETLVHAFGGFVPEVPFADVIALAREELARPMYRNEPP